MSSCLNCGNEVKNKYCNVSCQNEYRKTLNILQYQKKPSECIQCGNDLNYEQRKNKFCSISCSVSFNNKFIGRSIIKNFTDDEIIQHYNDSKDLKSFKKIIGYSEKSGSDVFKDKIIELGLSKKPSYLFNLTKKELFGRRTNWQSARSAIRKLAEKVFYSKYEKGVGCLVCGYNKHVDIAHLKSVSSFSDETLISEINDISNLIPLCKNHHYEYDNDLMEEEDKEKLQLSRW